MNRAVPRGGKRNQKVNSKDQMVAHCKEIEWLKLKIEELVVENDFLKKKRPVYGEATRGRSIDAAL